jgi:16S rRNA processing protein RimM
VRERARSSRSSSKRGRLTAHPESPQFLLVGTVGRAVGLRGEVDVQIVSDDPKRFVPGAVVLTSETHRELTIRCVRRQGARNIAAFEEVVDRNQAEALRGIELVVRLEDARPLEADEYWDHDLIGCAVVTTDGAEIGMVTDVLHQPANEVIVVSARGREVLVPMVAAVVKSVEPRTRITIDPPPGLLEDG